MRVQNKTNQQQLINTILKDFVEIKLNEADNFLKIRETLTRIGIPSRKSNTLFQSCHILHKQDKYYIVHFKEMFMLDNRPTDFNEEDKARRNTIINLLQQWGLITVVDSGKIKEPTIPIEYLKVLTFEEKSNWDLQPKYKIGRYKNKDKVTSDAPLRKSPSVTVWEIDN